MATVNVYTYPQNPRVWKAQIAAHYVGGVTVKEHEVKFGHDNKTPEFLSKNPLGKVPTADTPDGPLWESNAIARYVARLGKNNLYGTNNYEAALVEQWIEFTNNELQLPIDAWLYPTLGYAPYHPTVVAKAKEDVRKYLKVLNDHLLTRTFLVGQRVSLADIVLSMSLYRPYTLLFDPGYRKAFPNVNRWFQTCVHQPPFVAVIGGETKLAEHMKEPEQQHHHAAADQHHHDEKHHEKADKAAAAAAAASSSSSGGEGGAKPKKEKKKGGGGGGAGGEGGSGGGEKKEGEKKEGEKKEGGKKKGGKEKKEAAAAAASSGAGEEAAAAAPAHTAEEEEEPEEHKEPKKKSPLDDLPPSPMSLDEWKRVYSNKDTRTEAIPWLWQNFDAAGFGIWFAEHKHSAEFKKVFMTSNAVTGWIQRLDKLRKYGFGTILIFGEDEKAISVSSVWIFRGTEVAPEMKECDDYDLYEWKKVDLNDAAQKKQVEDLLAWEGEFQGRGKPKDGKTFK